MITAESGADTLNRNLLLRQRFAFARQRIYHAIASCAMMLLQLRIAASSSEQ